LAFDALTRSVLPYSMNAVPACMIPVISWKHSHKNYLDHEIRGCVGARLKRS